MCKHHIMQEVNVRSVSNSLIYACMMLDLFVASVALLKPLVDYCISVYPILNTVDMAIQPVTVREGDIWVREKRRVTERERERDPAVTPVLDNLILKDICENV